MGPGRSAPGSTKAGPEGGAVGPASGAAAASSPASVSGTETPASGGGGGASPQSATAQTGAGAPGTKESVPVAPSAFTYAESRIEPVGRSTRATMSQDGKLTSAVVFQLPSPASAHMSDGASTGRS